MPNLLFVMAGGAIGAGLRYGVGLAAPRVGDAFPWGTFIVNLSGGLCGGLLLCWVLTQGKEAEPLQLFLGVGLLGGFTTFSAFSVETASLLQKGELVMASAYILASVLGALAMVFAGLWLGRAAI